MNTLTIPNGPYNATFHFHWVASSTILMVYCKTACNISSALAMEILHSWTKPLIYSLCFLWWPTTVYLYGNQQQRWLMIQIYIAMHCIQERPHNIFYWISFVGDWNPYMCDIIHVALPYNAMKANIYYYDLSNERAKRTWLSPTGTFMAQWFRSPHGPYWWQR